MKVISKVKDGLKMGKEKAVSTIVGIGKALKDKENRLIIGMTLVGIGGAFIASCYVKIPQ